jgi:hypothetical protein
MRVKGSEGDRTLCDLLADLHEPGRFVDSVSGKSFREVLGYSELSP